MNTMKQLVAALILGLVGLVPAAHSQTTYSENFTSTGTNNAWYFLNGACLTAGTAATTNAATPACLGLAYYTNKGDTLFGGDTGTLPDTAANGGGALRFTNRGNENGAILSNFNFPLSTSGLAVSFTTVTYEGDSGGSGRDGADGISFFLQDATYPADVGAFGGSLGYTCSNSNNDGTLRPTDLLPRGYDGLAGGYIGLGIDEYGNFLNSGDNTSTGQTNAAGTNQFQPGRIGMRGPGSVLWKTLNATYPTQYPSTLSTSQRAAAVRNACQTGILSDWSSGSRVPVVPITPLQFTSPGGSNFGNYAVIPTAYKNLPATQPIANEAATMRSQAVPITYNLKITAAGLLSLSYIYNSGATQNVITNVDITQGGAYPLPDNVRFGFAGSTGGSRNIHEVMCFQATPSSTSQSSAGLNQKQTAKVQQGTQVYFAFYNPVTLAGSLTSQYLDQSITDPNSLTIDPAINWDGSCVLTGVTGTACDQTGPAGPTPAQASRTIVSFSPSATASTAASPGPGAGIPFQWASLSATQQAALDTGDTAPIGPTRLNYLRGDRSLEQVPATATTFTGIYRDRTSVLGDIIDSSPTWVGPPNATFPASWADLLHPATMAENSGQPYTTFNSNGTSTYVSGTASANHEQQRTNVVYAGANDGMLHGFRTGSFNSTNTYIKTSNDGQEVLAYVPGYIVNNIQSANPTRNYSDPQYGHRFDVDAPPGTGDLFYNGVWHTWLIGGLGAGGRAIYALDITDPDSMFSESNASGTASGSTGVVKGEWSTATSTSVSSTGVVTTTYVGTTLNCMNDSSTACGYNLGNTYGIPQIRRFHNGSWGAVFGNGIGSMSGDAGIYVMLVDPTSGLVTFYYLSTGTGSTTTPNGIAYVTPADLDGDHITDYVYAGDLLGNVWRFDLTSANASTWAVTPTKIFTTVANVPATTPASNQPITTKVSVISAAGTGSPNPRIIVEFGTGQQIPMTNSSAATYTAAGQSLYGIWDWNMSSWNSQSSTQQYASLSSHAAISGSSLITQQTITSTSTATATGTGTDYRTVSSNTVCYADISGCTQFGWYLNMVSGNAYPSDPALPQTGNATYAANPLVYEQVIFSPVVEAGAFIVNTTIPPATAPTMCFSSLASGWTMALNPATGGAFTSAFFGDTSGNFLNTAVNGQPVPVSGVALGGTGSPSMVQSGTQGYVVTQTVSGTGALIRNFPQGNTQGKRLTWIQKR